MASEIDKIFENGDTVLFDLAGVAVVFTPKGGVGINTIATVSAIDTLRHYDTSGDNEQKTCHAYVQIGGDTGITGIAKGDHITIDGAKWLVDDTNNETAWAVNTALVIETRKSKHGSNHVKN